MPAPKRKSPDGKRPVRRSPAREPGLASRLIGGAGKAVARHPKPLLGIAAFGVIFSFVAANALWYQPGDHPHPFLATRDAHDSNQIAGYRPMRRVPPSDVTTFRIERADTSAPARPQTQTAIPVQAPPPAQPPAAPPAAAVPLVNPQQQAATAPQQPAAPVQTPSKPPLADAAPIPQPMPARPAPAAAARPAKPAVEDPVAAAIRSSERGPARPAAPSGSAGHASPFGLPPADIPNTGSTPPRQTAAAAPAPRPAPRAPRSTLPKPVPVSQKPNAPAGAPASSLVLQIQRGLSNIAYADVETNGVAGTQTKAAIRAFQKHYRLPETGEPNEQVLKKLKSIGAL